jgi:methyltransferase (TIGR00027 family)
MNETDKNIHNVSDTSLWVAYYRAKESLRTDALFKDPLAQNLIGERGKKIADHMKSFSRFVEWSVIMRTLIIDKFILDQINLGVDAILNLGAGLDTRPYRMKLPMDLNWIEVDYENIIDHKNTVLKNEKPVCNLMRVPLDLADISNRDQFLSQINSKHKKILVLTEGVIVYLDEAQVEQLARDLFAKENIALWITEFLDPKVYPHLKGRERQKKMQNSPFKFFPLNWLGFFKDYGWMKKELIFSADESAKHQRVIYE